MPLDGLSFSNSGVYKITPPMEINEQVKQVSEVQAQTSIKKPEGSEKLKSELENENDQHKNLEGRDTEESNQEKEEKENYTDRTKYKVKFNPLTDMVELIDQNTGRTLETISSNDLVSLISKSKGSSGVFVDEKV